jgi:hypothetical protein
MRPRAAAENDTSIERCTPCDLDEAPVVDGVRGIYPVVGREGCSRQKTYAGRNGLVRLGAHVESRIAAREFGDRVGVVSRNPV